MLLIVFYQIWVGLIIILHTKIHQKFTQLRSTLFFVYTANPPKRPGLCTQYWDDTFPKPELSKQVN
jgi:hypothetical protein